VSAQPLRGRVALVTGAASPRGQGAAHARALAGAGATVVITDVADEAGEATAAALGAGVAYRHLDVTSAEGWAEVVDGMVARHGGLDVLVNNAGVWLARGLLETSPEDYRRVVEVNQTAVFLGMRAVAPALRARGGGSIVNISSAAGLRGARQPLAYAASKWAVRGMTKAAAFELAPLGIRVNSIHPGVIDTPMIEGGHDELAAGVPMGRLGRPEEVAELVLFLATDASAYVSGAEIAVDGAVTV
jgi:3alpha(or 20beta)-hydroxysteroid dehydrogenase